MLPHLRDRPISMQRFPDGIAGKGFFHKDAPDYFPDWIARARAAEGGRHRHARADPERRHARSTSRTRTRSRRTSGCRAPTARTSPTGSSSTSIPHEGSDFATVRRAARWTADAARGARARAVRPGHRLEGHPRLDAAAPARRHSRRCSEFARDAAQVLAERHPDELTTEFRKAKRGGRILVDVARNGYAQTAVPPYAVRPRPGAPVATPIALRRAVRLAPAPRPLDAPQRAAAPRAARATRGPTSQAHARGLAAPASGSRSCSG